MANKEGQILIVEDEVEITEMLSIMLEEYFEEIFIAHNGSEGLKQIRKMKDLSCVISDINMPVMDGIAMVKKIRQDGNQIPVIFFTGYGSESAMHEALKYGVFDFVDKPSFDNLEEIIKRAVASKFDNKKEKDVKFISEYQKLLGK